MPFPQQVDEPEDGPAMSSDFSGPSIGNDELNGKMADLRIIASDNIGTRGQSARKTEDSDTLLASIKDLLISNPGKSKHESLRIKKIQRKKKKLTDDRVDRSIATSYLDMEFVFRRNLKRHAFWDFPRPKTTFIAGDRASMQEGFRMLSMHNVFGFSIRRSEELQDGVPARSIEVIFFAATSLRNPLRHRPKRIGGFGSRTQIPQALTRWCDQLEEMGHVDVPSTVAFDLKLLMESNALEFSALYSAIFSSPVIRIVGVHMAESMQHLGREYGARCLCLLRPLTSLQSLSRVTFLEPRKDKGLEHDTLTLRELTARFANVKLPGNRHVSNWSKRPFTGDQWLNASYEAPASLLVYFSAGADSFYKVTNTF